MSEIRIVFKEDYPMDGGAWCRLLSMGSQRVGRDWATSLHFISWDPRHSSTLAWKIPWTEELGRLQSLGSLSQTWLSYFTFIFHFHALEKEMATHSSVLAWIIPGTAEPGGLPSVGSHRVGHDWSDLAAAAVTLLSVIQVWPISNPLCLYSGGDK